MKVKVHGHWLRRLEEAPPKDLHINIFAFECKCTWHVLLCGDIPYFMKTIHRAYKNVMKIMTCTMKNGRLQNDFMRNLSSHHKVAAKVADDHQV